MESTSENVLNDLPKDKTIVIGMPTGLKTGLRTIPMPNKDLFPPSSKIVISEPGLNFTVHGDQTVSARDGDCCECHNNKYLYLIKISNDRLVCPDCCAARHCDEIKPIEDFKE